MAGADESTELWRQIGTFLPKQNIFQARPESRITRPPSLKREKAEQIRGFVS